MTLQLEVVRDYRDATCTLATLAAPSGKRWQYLELPWVPDPTGLPCGLEGKSCVPVGLYKLVPHSTEQHPNVFALVNPDLYIFHEPDDAPVAIRAKVRVACLIHPANYPWELRGCGAPGKTRTKLPTGQWCVQSSRDAMNEIRGAVNGSYDLMLNITEAFS